MGIVRTTYLIDADGKVAKRWESYIRPSLTSRMNCTSPLKYTC